MRKENRNGCRTSRKMEKHKFNSLALKEVRLCQNSDNKQSAVVVGNRVVCDEVLEEYTKMTTRTTTDKMQIEWTREALRRAWEC